MQNTPKIILGIDPGTIAMGFGIISVSGNAMKLVELGTLKLSSKLNAYQKLEIIYKKVSDLIEVHQPSQFAIEAPFFAKNVQSMLKLGRSQGVAIAAAMKSNIPVSEYSPKKVKQSVTGNGNANKEQILHMVEKLLSIKCAPNEYDASDAVAVAICHSLQNTTFAKTSVRTKKASGWKQFISVNAHRLAG